MLASSAAPVPPAKVELRDDQIYRVGRTTRRAVK